MKDSIDTNEKFPGSYWDAFVTAENSIELSNAWLGLLCEQVAEVKAAAILVEGQGEQTYVPMAVWPTASPDMERLAKVIETSLRERRGIVQSAVSQNQPEINNRLDQLTQIAYPLMLGQRIVAIVAIEANCKNGDAGKILRDIHWGGAWLTSLFSGRELEAATLAKQRASAILELLAIALRQGKLQQALFETINELRLQMDCTRSAIGLIFDAKAKLIALSEAATFEKHTSLTNAYVRVMEETYDRGRILQYDKSLNTHHEFPEHYNLTQISGAGSVISCPLFEEGRIMGIITLERNNKDFSESDVAWLEAFTTMFAPILSQRRKAERKALLKLIDEGKSILRKLFGPKNLVWKTIATVSVMCVLILFVTHIDYRVTAKTVIEGEIQRAISAPFDGFIGTSYVRAGDTVKQGQVLGSLDDRDLIVERLRWSSERDQYENRLRESMATHDLVAVQVLSAQLNQAEAELDLVNKKIEHSKLVAPFDGLVVSGDLSQQIGAPVEIGKKLFEIAPLHSYRVILQVDEREIRHIQVGQLGKLVITGIAEEPMPLKIQKITPIATAQDGKNFFRVEAGISNASIRLRPGMEGIGKVVTENQSLWWVLMHSFTDWLRLTLWTWIP